VRPRASLCATRTGWQPYLCHLIVAVPFHRKQESGWAAKRDELDREVERFWRQFEPAIECVGVEVLGTEELTLAEIEPYQRFDADWVSFADGTSTIGVSVDMAS
jgi:hypothetical protein